jgi:hypothetical protein
LVRLVGIIASVLIAIDGFLGAMCNDLVVPEASKTARSCCTFTAFSHGYALLE